MQPVPGHKPNHVTGNAKVSKNKRKSRLEGAICESAVHLAKVQ